MQFTNSNFMYFDEIKINLLELVSEVPRNT